MMPRLQTSLPRFMKSPTTDKYDTAVISSDIAVFRNWQQPIYRVPRLQVSLPRFLSPRQTKTAVKWGFCNRVERKPPSTAVSLKKFSVGSDSFSYYIYSSSTCISLPLSVSFSLTKATFDQLRSLFKD